MRSYTTSMKLLPSTLAAFALYAATVNAQEPVSPPSTPPTVEAPDVAIENADIAPPTAEVAPAPALPGEVPVVEVPEEQEEMEDGMRLNDANLNTVFEVLARDAGLSYFHNNRIAGDEFKVNGYLKDGDALTQMEDLAFSNALTMHRRGNTIYALTSDQLNQLPSTEWTYQLKYLRSSNMKDHMRELISPLLSPNSGIVNYEEKTNTLIIIDTPHKIERVKSLLERIDRAKGQIVVEVKILRVNNTAAQNIGVDWSDTLGGATNAGITAIAGINSLLGLPSSTGSTISAGDLVFNPNQISAVLRALNEGGITKLQNNPVLITEDNETANISVIDRIPIITTETTQGSLGGSPTVTEEVRYRIDEDDSTDPETTREIGTTILVTPTLLPDNTIRLVMRPRTASVTDQITSQTGNEFPRVLESALTTIARIPNGHSLIVGGFFSEQIIENENKVPLLGDIPGLKFLFTSKSTSKETASLIFVVTPSSYTPADHASHHRTHNRIEGNLQVRDRKTTYDDLENYDLEQPNLNRTWNNIKKKSGLQRNEKPSSGTNKPYRVRR